MDEKTENLSSLLILLVGIGILAVVIGNVLPWFKVLEMEG